MGVAWTRLGTVTVTAGSVNVSGVDTRWQTAASIGDAFHGPDGKQYEVAGIVSDTALQLRTPYQGATAAGQAYAIMRIVPQGSDAETMALLRQVLNLTDTQLSAFMAWADSQGMVSISDGETTLPGLHGLRKLMADIAARPALSASGSLGLGVTPSAWVLPALELYNGSLCSLGGPYGQVNLAANAYATGADIGSSGWRYLRGAPGDLGAAALYSQSGAVHSWHTAPRGIAGQLVAFSPVMTLGESGGLWVSERVSSVFEHRSYTKATVPAASAYARCTIYVSDAVGGASPAWSDGTTWTSFKTNTAI